jgi:hypothetical protein
MKLPLIGYSKEQVVNAQWDIVTILIKGLAESHYPPTAAQQLLRDMLCCVREMDTPGEYVKTLTQALVAIVAKVQRQRDDNAASLKECEQECHILQMQVDYYHKHPLQEQLREQVEQINYWRSRAQDAEEDNAELKASLVREQRANQATQNRLQGEIAELRRLIVEQQETINVYTQ